MHFSSSANEKARSTGRVTRVGPSTISLVSADTDAFAERTGRLEEGNKECKQATRLGLPTALHERHVFSVWTGSSPSGSVTNK